MKTWIIPLSLSLLLGACAQVPAPGASQGSAAMSSMVLSTQALMANDWRLVMAIDAAGQPLPALQPGLQIPLQLHFSETQLNVSGGCNMMFGGYVLEEGSLKLPGLASTMKACEPVLMQLDTAVGQRLKGEIQARLGQEAEGRALTLLTQDGDTLQFQAVPRQP